MDTPLWSDERIERECTAELGYTSGMSSIALMRKVRDFYEAELAKVRAERDEWEPVPDGEYESESIRGFIYELDGKWLRTSYDGAPGWGCKLPTELGWRLCRRKAKE